MLKANGIDLAAVNGGVSQRGVESLFVVGPGHLLIFECFYLKRNIVEGRNFVNFFEAESHVTKITEIFDKVEIKQNCLCYNL